LRIHRVDGDAYRVAGIGDRAGLDSVNGRGIAARPLGDGLVGHAPSQQRLEFFLQGHIRHGVSPMNLCTSSMHQCILSTQGDIALCTARPQYAPMHKGIDYILAKLMARNGDNQVSLSKATGVGQSTISRILKPNGPKGIKSPTDDQVSRLAAHYLVSTDQLRGRASIPGLEGSTGEAEVARPAKSLPAKSSAELVRDMLAKHGKGLSEDARKQIVKAVEVVSAEPDAPSNVISHDFSGLRARPEEILIPQYDVRGAMGHGQVPADYNEAIRNLVIRED